MTHTVTSTGLIVDGVQYPFTPPEGFTDWLKTRQEAFVEGVLHVYLNGRTNPTANPPQPQEEPLL